MSSSFKGKTIAISSWREFRDLMGGDQFRSWAFRGQSDANWKINSTLYRYFDDFNVHKDAWTFQEKRILRLFRRKAQQYLPTTPNESDTFEWLALMQHHGAPSRLIDFTWSPLIAAYFALNHATKNSAVWAIFPPKIDHSSSQQIRGGKVIDAPRQWLRIPGNYEKFFLPGTEPFVVTGEPQIMNRRLTIQSGTFAVPGILDEPLESILLDYPEGEDLIVKIELETSKIRQEAMRDLYQSNIREVTLFPGLDGFARSLAYELEFHWAFCPASMNLTQGFSEPPEGLPQSLNKT